MNKVAIYPGTFDPVTKGHSDLICRAAKLFDIVIVAVAESSQKKTLFSTQQRQDLLQQVLASVKNIKVMSFKGLLVDFAQQQQANVVLRGVRSVADFEFELQLASANKRMNSQLETVFLTPSDDVATISSTLVREIASLHGDVSSFVDPIVAKAISAGN